MPQIAIRCVDGALVRQEHSLPMACLTDQQQFLEQGPTAGALWGLWSLVQPQLQTQRRYSAASLGQRSHLQQADHDRGTLSWRLHQLLRCRGGRGWGAIGHLPAETTDFVKVTCVSPVFSRHRHDHGCPSRHVQSVASNPLCATHALFIDSLTH